MSRYGSFLNSNNSRFDESRLIQLEFFQHVNSLCFINQIPAPKTDLC